MGGGKKQITNNIYSIPGWDLFLKGKIRCKKYDLLRKKSEGEKLGGVSIMIIQRKYASSARYIIGTKICRGDTGVTH